jgi:hypothetical protein
MASKAARKQLTALIEQIDALFPTLSGKPAADLLVEKASIIRQQIQMEQDAEERQVENTAADAAARVASLTEQLTAATARVTELERENGRLDTLSKTREVVTLTVSDPRHAQTAEERDLLQRIVTTLTATMSEQSRIESAVRLSLHSPAAAETYARLANVDWGTLSQYLKVSEVDLIRWSGVRDPKIALMVKTILALKFPPPKIEASTGYVTDTRSGEQRLADAKKLVRGL